MFTKALRALSSGSRDRERFVEDPYADRPSYRRRATGPELTHRQLQEPLYDDLHEESESDSDEYGFPQARKNSVSHLDKHKRTTSREQTVIEYICPGCGEAYRLKDGEPWTACKYCHVRPYDAKRRQNERLGSGPSPLRHSNAPRQLEESFKNLYRRFGVLLTESSAQLTSEYSTSQITRMDEAQDAQKKGFPSPPLPRLAGMNGNVVRSMSTRPSPVHDQTTQRLRTPPTREPPGVPNRQNSQLMTAPQLQRFNSARVAPLGSIRSSDSLQQTPTHVSRGIVSSPQSMRSNKDTITPSSSGSSPKKLHRTNGLRNLNSARDRAPIRDQGAKQQLLDEFQAEVRSIFGNVDLLNSNFCSTFRPKPNARSLSEGSNLQLRPSSDRTTRPDAARNEPTRPMIDRFDCAKPLPLLPPTSAMNPMMLDGKALLAGHIHDIVSSLADAGEHHPSELDTGISRRSTYSTSPHIYWPELQALHSVLVRYTLDFDYCFNQILGKESDAKDRKNLKAEMVHFTADVLACWIGVIYETLTAPREEPTSPQAARYLFLFLTSPLLLRPLQPLTAEYRKHKQGTSDSTGLGVSTTRFDEEVRILLLDHSQLRKGSTSLRDRALALILGRIANLSESIQHAVAKWFALMPVDIFLAIVRAVQDFTIAQVRRIPVQSQPNHEEARRIHDRRFLEVMGASRVNGSSTENLPIYSKRKSAWKLRAACQALQLLVVANDLRADAAARNRHTSEQQRATEAEYKPFPVDHFYTALLDPEAGRFEVAMDFDLWDARRAKFTLCQYPFLLTLGTKVKVLEYDNDRRKKDAVRAEWHGSRGLFADPYFHLPVRRDHIIEDSLKLIREARGSFSGQTSKKLRVHFQGEEAVDAGGPQKEWFLILTQELFNPDLGLFYICDSGHFWFHSACSKSNEFFELIGAVFGLAIYNQTSLFAPFPPFFFKKLAAAAPRTAGSEASWRHNWRPSLQDYAEIYPDLARLLKEGLAAPDTLKGLTFEIPVWQNGQNVYQPLGIDGTEREITPANIDEFVEKAINFVLRDSIKNQFNAFARGLYSICGGNALSLFRGEELELLVRGSEDFDLDTLKAAVNYDNWVSPADAKKKLESEDDVKAHYPVVRFFWDFFEKADIKERRRILRFITGTDRLPPAGIVNLVIKVSRLQMVQGEFRYPSARTCFNQIMLPDSFKDQGPFEKVFRNALEMAGTGFGMK